MTCAYGWVASATAARATKASSPKSAPQRGTKDTSALDREARDPRGPTLRLLAAAAAAPCDYDQGPDLTPDTLAVRLMPGFSIRPDASSSKPASCVPVGNSLSARSLSQA